MMVMAVAIESDAADDDLGDDAFRHAILSFFCETVMLGS